MYLDLKNGHCHITQIQGEGGKLDAGLTNSEHILNQKSNLSMMAKNFVPIHLPENVFTAQSF